MATAHEHFVKAERLVEAALMDPAERDFGPTSVGLLLTAAQVHATLAHAAALGANEELQPGLDHYCLCSDALGRLARHETDCPHYKPANDEGPAASPTEPSA